MLIFWLEVNYFLSLFGIKYNYIISPHLTPVCNSSHIPLVPSQSFSMLHVCLLKQINMYTLPSEPIQCCGVCVCVGVTTWLMS